MTEPTHNLTITQGDITLLPLKDGALVNPSNTGLILGSGVGGAIARRGGPYIQQTLHMARSKLNGNRLEPGKALDTEPGQLNCQRLIHVSIVGSKDVTDRLISNAILNAYDLADELELSQLAIPPIGTETAGFPFDKFLDIYWKITAEELPRLSNVKDVYLCIDDQEQFETACDYADDHVEEMPDAIKLEISESGISAGVFN